VAERLTGWRTSDAYGRRVAEVFRVVDGASRQPLLDSVELCLREQRPVSPPGERVLVRADGAEFAVRDSATPIRDRAGRTVGAVLVFRDLTELRGMEREMTYLASYDPLTGLLNRREFEKRLERALALYREPGTPHTLCYLDLDEFKVINDTCGHVAGDEMLKQIGALLQWKAPDGVTLARLGGDEFGVLIEGRPLAEARALARELLREILAFRFSWHDRTFAAGVSMGLVPFDADTGDLAALLSAADAACYVAKESGRNRIHEYRPHDRALAERYGEMQWIHRIGKALEDERFRLYYQPIRALGGGAREPLAEVFIRLLDERGELVAPSAFIPAAERYHMIPAIDRWVVSQTLQTVRRRADLPAELAFTINLSGQSLGEEAFQHFVIDALRSSEIEPRRICFEITETAAIANLGRAMSFIAVLRRMGCRFVLDDFGSGFSSFGYLKNLPVDFLKIDGEFVRGVASDPINRSLVQAINQVGHVLGVRTIAESVEDEATLRELVALGVDYAQGYWISQPLPLPADPA
jgi:diguanylate cyclase (GGDEF)-like protein/PAS domain S-box-containing protein